MKTKESFEEIPLESDFNNLYPRLKPFITMGKGIYRVL